MRAANPCHPEFLALAFTVCMLIVNAGCTPARVDGAMIAVFVMVDGSSEELALAMGSTVEDALALSGVTVTQTDRVTPPPFTVLTGGEVIVVTRVVEEFETRQVILSFERQELRNESLPAGETRLIQAGVNGLSEVTIRHVFENGIEASSSIVTETLLQSPVPEIVMIGVQSPFAPIVIPGKLVYLTGGNAWVMEESTAIRRPLVTTGDLDGHVFSLSPDGKWLLYSRKSELPASEEINTLWAVRTDIQSPQPIDLGVSNIVHFADWRPGEEYVISYSTVEPRSTAPGWQANNDLQFLSFQNGEPGRVGEIVEANPGGIYGWWGMTFAWTTDGSRLAYARPDSIGLVDIEAGSLDKLLDITPLNTYADWAWTSNIAWSTDNRLLFFVSHAPPSGLSAPEESTNFDLSAYSLVENIAISLIKGTGMFSHPVASPLEQSETGLSYQVAYLQAASPNQSATSRYRLMLLPQDGTAAAAPLFPAEGVNGLVPQPPAWSPILGNGENQFIAVIYDGNLWIVDAANGEAQQVTGDGLTARLDWE